MLYLCMTNVRSFPHAALSLTHPQLNVLFKSSPRLSAAVSHELQAMYGRPNPGPYVAVHLRLGGLKGEPKAITRSKNSGQGDIHVMAAAAYFGHKMATALKIDLDRTPVALITDNNFLRW